MKKVLISLKINNEKYHYLIGAILSTGVSVVVGYLLGSGSGLVYAVLGSFAYAFLTFHSLKENIQNIIIHGLVMLTMFNIGLLTAYQPVLIPFVLSLIFTLGYLLSEILNINNPKYFYVLLMFATGLKGLSVNQWLNSNFYIICGIIVSLFSATFLAIIYNIPWYYSSNSHIIDTEVSIIEKVHRKLSEKPQLFIVALHGAFTFFIVGYLVVLFNVNDSIWLIISCTAVISADEIFLIRKKFFERVLGSIIGIFLGYIIISSHLPLILLLSILIVTNGLFEMYIKNNYLIANIFTNPLVLILSQFVSSSSASEIALHRIIFLIIGGAVSYFSMFLFYKSLDHIYYY